MNVKEESAIATLHLNTKKTKVMTTEEIHNFNINNEDVKIVKDFVSLGSVINSNEDGTQEITCESWTVKKADRKKVIIHLNCGVGGKLEGYPGPPEKGTTLKLVQDSYRSDDRQDDGCQVVPKMGTRSRGPVVADGSTRVARKWLELKAEQVPCPPHLATRRGARTYVTVRSELGEVKKPRKTIPKCTFTAVLLVTTVYLLVNISYLTLLTPREILSSDAVAFTGANRVLPSLTWVIPFGISASLFSNILINVFQSSRVTYIAGQEGQLPLFNSHSSPFMSVLLLVTMASIVVVSTHLTDFINYLYFVVSIWSVLSMTAILKLSYQEPNLPRPYKLFPGVFAISTGSDGSQPVLGFGTFGEVPAHVLHLCVSLFLADFCFMYLLCILN
ncbi:PREDICTED: LOW QUALITY PROTEIN: solute carrier family 7 member 13 [Hipposideros armiger]|uniref:LOW QUALITY PROTEIN: solute carrier family 7 member 13 n=1 Tax=Hipposideros armiger TaxID=186990 RepID=A0A8B7S667_HIPAR|nr:PREDICTED: LOW QUALITY PROTEIN: solute carrier family 7 member 13 [Hipposideros armiger]